MSYIHLNFSNSSNSHNLNVLKDEGHKYDTFFHKISYGININH